MATYKIILYYGFTPLADPKAVQLWQLALAEQWNLKGRVLVSKHGINGTLGGRIEDLKQYVKRTRQYPGFGDIEFKWSEGTGNDFPRLSVKERAELVAFGAPDEIEVTTEGVVGGGVHLKPEEVKQMVETRDDVVFFDGRNAFEAKIGRFRDAVVPDVETTHDFLAEIESGKYDHLKDKPVITYCTGGIRCEILSVLMKNRGFNEVYQVDGGIVRYGEKFGNDGIWQGSLYVFDDRLKVDFSKDPEILGTCKHCGDVTADFYNCANLSCRKRLLFCSGCVDQLEYLACDEQCVAQAPARQEQKMSV